MSLYYRAAILWSLLRNQHFCKYRSLDLLLCSVITPANMHVATVCFKKSTGVWMQPYWGFNTAEQITYVTKTISLNLDFKQTAKYTGEIHVQDLFYLPNNLFFYPSSPDVYTAQPCGWHLDRNIMVPSLHLKEKDWTVKKQKQQAPCMLHTYLDPRISNAWPVWALLCREL